MNISLPYLAHLQFFFNLEIFVVVRLLPCFRSIKKSESGTNLKPNPITLFCNKAFYEHD